MKSKHAIGWASVQAADELAAKAQEVYPDTMQPEADRTSLREKWCVSVKTLRAGRGFLMDRHVQRITGAEAA